MFTPFICGSFHHQDEEEEFLQAWCPSSRKSRRNKSLCRVKDNKNPYAHRGLDKFSALLADLDRKRQKIYTRKGSQDISLVLFTCSSPTDCRPIIVKMKEQNQNKTKGEDATDKYVIVSPTTEIEVHEERMELGDESKKEKNGFAWNYMKFDNWRQPYYYFPAIMMLILVLVAMFGRSFAIICASIGWYLVPTIEGGISNPKRMNKKKEYERRLSNVKFAGRDDGISSPRSSVTGTE